MTINEVAKNLIGMAVTDDFKDDVVYNFGGYTFEGETYVIVNKDESNDHIDYQAYIDHKDAPIVCIKIEDGKIKDAWVA